MPAKKKKSAAKKPASKKPASKKPASKKPTPKKKPAPKKPAAKSAAPKGKPAAGKGDGTQASPWQLLTPSGSSSFSVWRDEGASPPALVCQVGSTQLRYDLRCIDDLQAMLKQRADWMLLGAADEQKPAADDTVEAWGRSPKNPVGGWYGLRKGYRGRFGMYLPPVLEKLGVAEVEHNPKNNRMRAT